MNIGSPDIKEQVNVILSNTYRADDEQFVKKVAALVHEAYADATPDEWQRVNQKFCTAFGMDDDAVAMLLHGEVAVRASPPLLSPVVSIEDIAGDGWFGRYLEWTQEHEAPSQFHFGASLACVAAGFGRSPVISGWQARATFPNLYVLLVGPTGARKGSAIERAVNLAKLGFDIPILPNEGTHQGFASALRRFERMPGSKGAQGLIIAPEYSVLMKEDKNKGSLVQWLTDWYDCPDRWERALRGEEDYELNYVCVNMLGGSNMAWLRLMPSDAILGGFLPRQLCFNAPGKRHWKARPAFNEKLEIELVKKLIDVKERGWPEAIKFDQGAEKFLDNWYEVELRAQYESAGTDENFRAWLDRKMAAVLKVGTVWQLLDGGPLDVLTADYLTKARNLVDWCDRSVGDVYSAVGVTKEGEPAQDVLAMIVRNGGRMTQRKATRTLRNRYDAKRIMGALVSLHASGELEKELSVGDGVIWKVRE